VCPSWPPLPVAAAEHLLPCHVPCPVPCPPPPPPHLYVTQVLDVALTQLVLRPVLGSRTRLCSLLHNHTHTERAVAYMFKMHIC